MKIIVFILTLVCFFNLTANSVYIDTVYCNYYNNLVKQKQLIVNYKLKNISDEDYLTWVSITPVEKKSDRELVYEFFKQRKGDFSWLQMMYEGLLETQIMNVGYSFIKNIHPNETFSYYVCKIDKKSFFYEDRIVIIQKKKVEQYLKEKLDDKYFFQLPYIVLIDGKIESSILTDNGYAVPDSVGGYDYYYYVKDWQGNVRAVIDEANRRVELNNYYPYGMPMSSTASVQPYKYGGKELDRTNGLDMYDFGARWYDMIVPHFITIDPLTEKYPSISPYAYCAGNPIRYVDYRGDSISLAPIQKLDQTLNSNFMQTILSDLNNITGLSLTVSSDGILTYKNQIGEKAEGSMTARNMLIAAIENKDMVSVMTAHRSASPIGKNEIWLGIRQIDNFINGASNVNKLTLGWGMTFLHELLHTNVGGALQDFPYNPGPVVEIMNTIRSELNGNFGQRMQYNAKAINGSSYIPFDDLSDSFLRNGLSPHPNSMFIKF